ncbi:formate dehydrogenase accessory sulfurtransferase FdhD [Halanaerobium kushneri]|jgi:FdhD protein|uniref:Sulfur carrier protein FdhD n=1 Tax=Halanaerobium kushneri TaxID=56779 RepID=A0A1N7AAJ1_9FIRM|nr:formate dehydrogenase accessory sulfurtransferase FdhD [Halanaerobium kushneri]SIR36068.1 FdhD protein [Halanaerobium kushneri]
MEEKVIIRKNIRKFKINKFIDEQDLIISEEPLTLFINGYQFLTLMVLQENLEELIIGFLAAEGIIEVENDLKKIDFKYDKTVAMIEVKGDFSPAAYKKRTLTSGCGGGSTFINLKDCAAAKNISSDLKVIAAKIPLLMSNLQQNTEYFHQTGGTHIAALATDNQIIYQFEDIGRHNTIDKVIGRALKDNIQLANKIVLTSGRISSEMVVKILKQKIPFLVSRSAPTEAAIKIARARNLTLIGFCRGKRFNIYSGEERIKLD